MSAATPRKTRARRSVIGTVKSTRMSKTITVVVTARRLEPRFKKYVRRTQVYKVHDEKGEARPGDRVEITETRPLSRTKHFRLVRVIARGDGTAALPEVESLADIAPAAPEA
jgi:small subunit ribosomal protein S17